jgi:hypothetical protein
MKGSTMFHPRQEPPDKPVLLLVEHKAELRQLLEGDLRFITVRGTTLWRCLHRIIAIERVREFEEKKSTAARRIPGRHLHRTADIAQNSA